MFFKNNEADIILGDFNSEEFISEEKYNYKDLITKDMITFKPAQTTIDHIFVNTQKNYDNKIEFNGIVETFASDHNLISFKLNI